MLRILYTLISHLDQGLTLVTDQVPLLALKHGERSFESLKTNLEWIIQLKWDFPLSPPLSTSIVTKTTLTHRTLRDFLRDAIPLHQLENIDTIGSREL